MTLSITKPSMIDILVLARDMSEEERAQFETASGLQDVTPETVARTLLAYRGVEYVMVDEKGAPVSAFGGFEVSTGVFQTWMLSRADAFENHGLALTRACRKVLRGCLELEGFHRIQTLASPHREGACAWYQRGLGMTLEGVLRKFFPDGSDAALFSIIKGD